MNRFLSILAVVSLFSFLSLEAGAGEKWKAAEGPLMTRWAKEVRPDRAWQEYPRPQLQRKDWLNLNGLWDYSIVATNSAAAPAAFEGKILVPFAVESALSGVMRQVGKTNFLWYRRAFNVPSGWKGKMVLLNFGAIDWESTVWINGVELGSHRGGYDGFSLDISAALKGSGAQEILVRVWDPTDAGTQPVGKQHAKPQSIWYTAVTGIWQTAWLEPVDATSVESVKIVPNIDDGLVEITATLRGGDSAEVEAAVYDGTKLIGKTSGRSGAAFVVKVANAKLWAPDSPHLYGLKLTTRANNRNVDVVNSYFGMRKIALQKDEKGIQRIFLNNKFQFEFGPLDQGWWPDGLYTAPNDDALRYDIEMTKKLGMNLARKHVKVEPDRWYYWADKLGLLVWQDMPNGDRHIRPQDPDIQRTAESAAQYELELKRLIDGRRNHPAIIIWVPFNEGWGQFDTARVTDWIKQYDPSRLVINTSGWSDRGVGDIMDMHRYPGPAAPKAEEKRAIVLGEFGGLGLPVHGHTWQSEKNWGYRSFTNATALTEAYLNLIDKLEPLIADPGLSAAIYTQTTDVEIEVNGLMTYDRAMVKMDLEKIARANRRLYAPKAAAK
jgi:beta-galactosidase/beta-glucuronidase